MVEKALGVKMDYLDSHSMNNECSECALIWIGEKAFRKINYMIYNIFDGIIVLSAWITEWLHTNIIGTTTKLIVYYFDVK